MAIEKCAHAGCTCLPAPTNSYCCQHCEGVQEKGMPEEVGCGCGHIGCDPRSIPAGELEGQNIAIDSGELVPA